MVIFSRHWSIPIEPPLPSRKILLYERRGQQTAVPDAAFMSEKPAHSMPCSLETVHFIVDIEAMSLKYDDKTKAIKVMLSS